MSGGPDAAHSAHRQGRRGAQFFSCLGPTSCKRLCHHATAAGQWGSPSCLVVCARRLRVSTITYTVSKAVRRSNVAGCRQRCQSSTGDQGLRLKLSRVTRHCLRTLTMHRSQWAFLKGASLLQHPSRLCSWSESPTVLWFSEGSQTARWWQWRKIFWHPSNFCG